MLTSSIVSRSGYIAARDQIMVKSGVTKGGKNTARSCQFSFFLFLSQKFPEEKQQLVEEEDADNIRKVLLFVNHSLSGIEN